MQGCISFFSGMVTPCGGRMRLDEQFVFFDYTGSIAGQCGPVGAEHLTWHERLARFQRLAVMAKEDWSRSYVMVDPMVTEEEKNACKAALLTCPGGEGLHPPASWYREMKRTNPARWLPTVERELLIGSKECITGAFAQMRKRKPGVLFCGTHDLGAELMGYRCIVDVPPARLEFCIGSLFTGVTDVGGAPNEWVMNVALSFGLTINNEWREHYVRVA